MHGAGIIHRDIKPANVLIPSGDEGLRHPKLTDFGIALMTDSTRMTATGFMAGTANYLSPEQVLGEPVTPASDIYSLGLVLLEALSGEPVFPGHGVEAALARLNTQPLPPPGLTPGLTALLGQMTARDPGQRPSADDARRGFRRLLGDGLTSDVFALDSTSADTTRRTAWRPGAAGRRHRGAVAASLVGVGGALTAGLLFALAGHSSAGGVATPDQSVSSTTSPSTASNSRPGSASAANTSPAAELVTQPVARNVIAPPASAIAPTPALLAPPTSASIVVAQAGPPPTVAHPAQAKAPKEKDSGPGKGKHGGD